MMVWITGFLLALVFMKFGALMMVVNLMKWALITMVLAIIGLVVFFVKQKVSGRRPSEPTLPAIR